MNICIRDDIIWDKFPDRFTNIDKIPTVKTKFKKSIIFREYDFFFCLQKTIYCFKYIFFYKKVH